MIRFPTCVMAMICATPIASQAIGVFNWQVYDF
jgi:hypothetical protein